MIRWVPAKVKTSHLDETAILNEVSRTAVTYQTTKTLLCGVFGLQPLDTILAAMFQRKITNSQESPHIDENNNKIAHDNQERWQFGILAVPNFV